MEIFFSILTYLLVMVSPLILFYGLLNMQYELLYDRLVIKFFGIKSREIFYKKINGIQSFEQFPFIKNPKWQNIYFNKAISLDLIKENMNNKPSIFNVYFTKKTIISPKNRDEFFQELDKKINKFKNL